MGVFCRFGGIVLFALVQGSRFDFFGGGVPCRSFSGGKKSFFCAGGVFGFSGGCSVAALFLFRVKKISERTF
jgi:hypothetical protein